MKKALFVLAALLTSACSSDNTRQEPTMVYRGLDDQGCNYYNGVCNRAPRKFVVQNGDTQETIAYQQPSTTAVANAGEYKHCSAVMFGDSVPAPKVIASGPKVVQQNPQVRYVAQQPVQYVQQPVQYVQAAQVVQAQNICPAGNSGCQPTITQTREPVEVLFKKTTTTTVYEPKTTQEVAYEKEPFVGQVPCTNCDVQPAPTAPTVVQTPTLTIPAPTVINVPTPVAAANTATFTNPTQPVAVRVVRRTMPEAQMVSEIEMESSEIK